ncbi:MAG: hypothetical protein JRF45_04750 [Deltaproteobacteria bacterium]|nr:hypothetical protein [Deltaproteobacteria bacterium]MBW1969661.1 hypothetical protein [Deltaproteobacteria bacterium]MBW2157073.1 hypothetical protein [Deltaproteobacteria bacterium]MBW2198159.1 hypothetical protein [Deltaproteobacteria bacterium]MBW2325802.1 hypothetical protein [Deltaproteobacteria bacterium]
MNRVEEDGPSRKISITGPQKIVGVKNADVAVSLRNERAASQSAFQPKTHKSLTGRLWNAFYQHIYGL